jgi:glucose/arabinose dehydrogenase
MRYAAILLGFASFLSQTPTAPQSSPPIERIKVPAGFAVDVYATGVTNARQMTRGDKGTLFVGSMQAGLVHAVVDKDNDQKADEVLVIAKGLRYPSGLAFRDGSLYVAEISRVIRFDRIEDNLQSPPEPVVVNDSFPTDRSHGWKFIAFGPDGMLYVPVGAPCNICEPTSPIYASITRMKPDGSGRETFASGIRNTVGFDWHPVTKELWFTDNGRDAIGDDTPPDELNRAPKAGLNFGFPYCHGGDLPDPEFGSKKPCSEFEPPARKLDAHVAAIGMRFYTGNMFPAEYRNQIFIAEHGSWNRSKPQGYRVMLVRLEGNKVVSYEPFAEGWLNAEGPQSRSGVGDNFGRPADVFVMPDGALLVSDDARGVIYRISYKQ